MKPSKLLVYCEKNAWGQIRRLWREGRIDLVHFPYDAEDRRWHDKRGIPLARPSLVTLDSEVRVTDPIRISDAEGSDLHPRIARVLGKHPRDFDVRHFDSAYKSRAHVFVTCDTDLLDHADELYQLSGVHVVGPDELERLIDGW